MGRQRTIDDASFWRSPAISECTQEDKATLLYLLTSPSSNVIGVYQIVMRVAAAEMGWTPDQLAQVLRRLQEAQLIRFDDKSSYVWVKIWWAHNSAKMAVGQKLRERTLVQISQIPPQWVEEYLTDFAKQLPRDLQQALGLLIDGNLSTVAGGLQGRQLSDSVSDRVSDRGGLNTNSINIQNSNFTAAARATPAAGEASAFARLSALFDLPAANPAVIAQSTDGRTVVPGVAELELAKIRSIRLSREERGGRG